MGTYVLIVLSEFLGLEVSKNGVVGFSSGMLVILRASLTNGE